MSGHKKDLDELVKQKVEGLRPKLLDLSRRNPLISTKLGPRSNAHIRVVDELPDVLFYNLNNNQKMRLVPLPPIEDDPRDEQTDAFTEAVSNARLTDEVYLAEAEKISASDDDYTSQSRELERRLKDRVREQLSMPPRPSKNEINILQHARNNGITPSYELPSPDEEHEDGRHTDIDIQTLLLPKELERKLNGLNAKCRTWVQETGMNVLHVAYGLLEWAELGSTETSFAPLILAAAQMEKQRTREGVEFWIAGTGDEPEVNAVLAEKLRLDFHIEIPPFNGSSVEDYLESIAALSPRTLTWRVRRQIVIGVFPSARMAMYHDLNTQDRSFEQNDIVQSLLAGSNSNSSSPFADEYNIDDPSIERKVPCLVLDADSSQFSTLADIADGKSLAVEGPPGTGKSQTIVNAIAAALADGKKVLFVAEKLAALNVVKSRLEAVGLGEFLLPLQAERSTREQVMESIRTRTDMRPGRASREYEEKLEEFRRVRDMLARYIDIITEEFEDTGLTVHEILGRSIASDERLAGIPIAVFDECRLPSKSMRTSGLAQLRSLGDQIEQAYAHGIQAQDHWKGAQLVHPERFAIEEACDFGARAAQAYTALADARPTLEDIDLPADMRLLSIDEIANQLERSSASTAHLPARLVATILDGGHAQPLKTFLERCKQCQTGMNELKDVLALAPSPAAVSKIRNILEIYNHAAIDTIDVRNIAEQIANKRAALTNAHSLAAKLTPFVEEYPESSKWRLRDFGRAYELIEKTGREALVCRNANTAAATAAQLIRQYGEDGQRLRSERESLSEKVSVAADVPVDRLSASLTVIRTSGAFSVFSGEFREAKRLYRSVCRSGSFKKPEAITTLEQLVAWRVQESDFSRNPQVTALFGIYFRGIETDFDVFQRLADFYDALARDFSKPASKSIRKFLRDSEFEALEDLPEIPARDDGLTYEALIADIEKTASTTEALEQAVAGLASNIDVFKRPETIRPADLKKLAGQTETVCEEIMQLNSDAIAEDVLGTYFEGWKTDVEALAPAMDWAANVGTYAQAIGAIFDANKIDAAKAILARVRSARDSAEHAMSAVCAAAKIEPTHFIGERSEQEIADKLAQAAQDADGLQAHAELATCLLDIREYGLSPLVEERIRQSGDLKAIGTQFEALANRVLARAVYAKHGRKLSKYTGAKLNQLRTDLANNDREIIKLSRKQLRAKIYAAGNAPRGNGIGKKSTWTEMALIENEISKKQRFISVRDLTERAGRALLELKPCWMMSPLAVAQYIQKKAIAFDLCIIDEASQMPPEAAIGALLRSKQTMIVGDTNQLPPTSFFRKMIDEDDADEDEAVLNESILEMANATFRPPRRLRWHYRSRHSGLIRFSNHLVYDDNLIVFPSATEALSRMGVEFRAVQGRYKAGTNAIEAKAVAEAALEFMRKDPDRSLGIVTLNQKQRDLIREEFEHAIEKDKAAQKYVEAWNERKDGLEEFFIKNLENVQGDERDVIFIGTVYGPEEIGGPVMQRFGPINGLAGKRRLNVLFSRAKEKIVTFSSMTSANITAEESGNAGVYMLKRWLEYCATGVLETGQSTEREPDSDFEVYVMDQIRSMGCEPVPQVGVAGYFIDIGVKHPDWPYGFILGVECDGASYHSAKSARDRDRLRQEVLEGLGWRLHRIWSTDWFNTPQREARVLRQVITDRLAELKAREAEFTQRQPATIHSIADHMEAATERPAEWHRAPGIETQEVLPGFQPRTNGNAVAVGDTVRVRYLSEDKKLVQVTISQSESNPSEGVIHYRTPFAKALLGAEKGEEVEVLVGSYVRQAIVENIIKKAS